MGHARQRFGTDGRPVGLMVGLTAAAVVIGIGGSASPAAAGTRDVETVDGPQRVADQNTLAGGTFSYSRARTTLTARVKDVQTGTTRVGARIVYPGGTVVKLVTRMVDDVPVASGTIAQHGRSRPLAVDLVWDEEQDRVGFVIDNHRGDPRKNNTQARFAVYTLTAGSWGRPVCGPRVDPLPWCHDDRVDTTLRRH